MKHGLMALALAGGMVLAGYHASAQPGQQGTMGQQGMQGMNMSGQGMMGDHSAVEKALTANEEKINAAFAKRDVAGMKAFVADDAVAVDANGAMTGADMFKQLPTMDIKLTEQASTGFKFAWIDATTVAMSYTWTGKGTYMGMPVPSPVYASTVWTKRGAKWVAVFHQETAAAPPMKK